MNAYEAGANSVGATEVTSYGRMPLAMLIERIVHSSDQLALHELHDHRTLFRLPGGDPMLLSRFLDALADTRWAQSFASYSRTLLEQAYNLTIDKFANLPKDQRNTRPQKPSGPDCRHYFRSVLSTLKQWLDIHPGRDPLREEIVTSSILQRRVMRHYYLSFLEAKRGSNPTRVRYAWRLDQGVIYVWMPARIPSSKRRAWLESNVVKPDPSQPGEQHRVQRIVDAYFGVGRRVPLDSNTVRVPATGQNEVTFESEVERDIGIHGLAQVVANEKANSIEQQRPAIRGLGRSCLRRLILVIFDRLLQDCYEEKRVAEMFGLSRSTLTRFAGSLWKVDADGRIPDLWANTAQTLAAHASFMEAAEAAGVWDSVELILANRQHRQPRSHPDV